MKCKRKMGYHGDCKEEVVEGKQFCQKHLGETCRVCGAVATCECCYAVSLVCGIRLCDDCKCPNHLEKGA